MHQRYSLGAIILHWLIAALLAFQLSVGFGLEELGPRGFALYQLHKSIGIAVLLLTLLRIGWRWVAPAPPPLEKGWRGILAKAVHLGLYVFMLGAPLTGWLLVSTDRVKVPTLLFGTVPWPHLPVPDRFNALSGEAHELIGWIGIALFTLHVAGAVRHQWALRDPVMRRMSPGRTAWPVLLLSALLPIGWGLGLVALHNARTATGAARPPAPTMPAPLETPPAVTPIDNAAVPAPNAATAPPHWTIKPGGTLAFSVDNGGAAINGRFARWSGTIVFDPDHPDNGANIRIAVDLGSASVGDATQDQMLAGSDFLDTASHPRAIYEATSVRRTGPNAYAASGRLSLKGMSRTQSIRFALSGTGAARHVEGRATISRAAFGIGSEQASQTLGPDVSLTFRFDAASETP